jgi:outer membrane protein TolC
MLSKIYKTYLFTTVVTLSMYGASEDILSQTQKDALNLSQEKIILDAKTLKNDWINPITYTYSYSDSHSSGVSKTSTIAINQPIFKSGGIYYAIKYANNLKDSSLLSIETQKKELIKQAISLAFSVKKTNLQIEQQKLAIKNATIDLKVKKESVLNGLLDSSFLNNAVITLNNQKSVLLDLEHAKLVLLNSFNNLSDKNVDEIQLPLLAQIDQENFINNNLEITKNEADVKVQKNLSQMAKAKFLPTINVNYSKTLYHNDYSIFEDGDTNDVLGFNIVMPFDIKAFDTIDSSKLEYKKTQNTLKIKENEAINFFKSQNLKIAMLDSKINLTKENINSYTELLSQMNELYNTGLKTSDDVAVLENSKKSETLKIQILEYEKQIELLEIYGKIISDKI